MAIDLQSDKRTQVDAEACQSLTATASKSNNSPEDTSDDSPESSSTLESLPLPPDGGYGWVVVAVTFLGYGVLDGMPGVTGVLMPHLLEEFGQGRAKTALASSIFVGVFLMLGPFVGVLIHLVGCRPVAIAGGLICAVGTFASAFAPNIEVFILTAGAISGLGASMLFLPFGVMPNYYFEKRRAIALGISTSGAGMGLIVMPQLAALALSEMDWRSMVVYLSGIILQTVVLGALLRPLSSPSKKPKLRTGLEEPHLESQEGIKACPSSTSSDSGTVMDFDCPSGEYKEDAPLMSNEDIAQAAGGTTKPSNAWVQSCYDFNTQPDHSFWSKQNKDADRNIRSIMEVSSGTGPSVPKNIRSIVDSDLNSRTTYATSCYEFSKIPDIANRKLPIASGQVNRKQMRQELLRPFAERRTYITGSAADLPEFQSQPDVTSYLKSLRSLPSAYADPGSGGCCRLAAGPLVQTMRTMLDISILIDPSFLLIGFTASFVQLGYFVPIIFMADHTSTLGLTAGQSASLVAAFGVTNSLGRILSGLLANRKGINSLHIHAVSLFIAGLSCCLGVTYCTTYITLLIYISAYGLSIAMFVPIHTVFLVEYLGIARLTSAYGFLAMMKGVANIIGPAISGTLIDTTGSFRMAYYFGGGMMILAGVIPYFLPLVLRLRRKKEQME